MQGVFYPNEVIVSERIDVLIARSGDMALAVVVLPSRLGFFIISLLVFGLPVHRFCAVHLSLNIFLFLLLLIKPC